MVLSDVEKPGLCLESPLKNPNILPILDYDILECSVDATDFDKTLQMENPHDMANASLSPNSQNDSNS